VEGYCSHARTWPFVSILALALTQAFDYVSVEMPMFTPMYLNGWDL